MRTVSDTTSALSWVPLKDLAIVIMGQSPPSSVYNTDGQGLPFFQGKAEFGPVYPTVAKWCSEPTKIAEPGDVLISVRAPVGPTNLADVRCCIGRGLAAIRPSQAVRTKWILYSLRSLEKAIDELGTGTTFKAISGEILRQLAVPVASLEYQDAVVAEIEKQFSRLDEAVASLKRTKANLKRYKAAVLKAAVEGKLTEDWRLSARAASRRRAQASELEAIPKAEKDKWFVYIMNAMTGRTMWGTLPIFMTAGSATVREVLRIGPVNTRSSIWFTSRNVGVGRMRLKERKTSRRVSVERGANAKSTPAE